MNEESFSKGTAYLPCIQCFRCPEPLLDISDFYEHYAQHHMDDLPNGLHCFTCEACGSNFQTQFYAMAHSRSCSVEKHKVKFVSDLDDDTVYNCLKHIQTSLNICIEFGDTDTNSVLKRLKERIERSRMIQEDQDDRIVTPVTSATELTSEHPCDFEEGELMIDSPLSVVSQTSTSDKPADICSEEMDLVEVSSDAIDDCADLADTDCGSAQSVSRSGQDNKNNVIYTDEQIQTEFYVSSSTSESVPPQKSVEVDQSSCNDACASGDFPINVDDLDVVDECSDEEDENCEEEHADGRPTENEQSRLSTSCSYSEVDVVEDEYLDHDDSGTIVVSEETEDSKVSFQCNLNAEEKSAEDQSNPKMSRKRQRWDVPEEEYSPYKRTSYKGREAPQYDDERKPPMQARVTRPPTSGYYQTSHEEVEPRDQYYHANYPGGSRGGRGRGSYPPPRSRGRGRGRGRGGTEIIRPERIVRVKVDSYAGGIRHNVGFHKRARGSSHHQRAGR